PKRQKVSSPYWLKSFLKNAHIDNNTAKGTE
ncbi:uncharacterized protein METZ01_LOCUS357554, partial [marine metagenome]